MVELLNQAKRLRFLIRNWILKRKESVHTLRVLAQGLMVHHNNVCIAKVAGSSASVAGFALAAAGFGLSFVTFGASLILAGIGSGVGALGRLTSFGSGIAKTCIQNDTFDTAQRIIDNDREATEEIARLSEEIGREAQKSNIGNGLKAGLTSALIVKEGVGTGLQVAARIAGTAASEGGEALFRGLSVAGRVAHIGGFVISTVLLPGDIYTLVTSSMKIDAARKGKKDQEPEAVKKLRELANELEKNIPNENDSTRELDDFISKTGKDSNNIRGFKYNDQNDDGDAEDNAC